MTISLWMLVLKNRVSSQFLPLNHSAVSHLNYNLFLKQVIEYITFRYILQKFVFHQEILRIKW